MPTLLELFSGTKILSSIAKTRGWDTVTVDNDAKTKPDICTDASNTLAFIGNEKFDMVWASPPCESFSVASIGKHWGGGWRAYQPKTEQATKALQMIKDLKQTIETIDPIVWYIENPRGVMRKVCDFHEIRNSNTTIVLRHTVTYCQYGEERMKPTDIWTNDFFWTPRPMCHNGDSCHVRAPRGAKTGTQGRNGYLERSRLPATLCVEILDSAETCIEAHRQV